MTGLERVGVYYCTVHHGVINEDSDGPCDFAFHDLDVEVGLPRECTRDELFRRTDDRPMWNFEDPDNPRPLVWPQCPECDVSWVWKRAFSLTTGSDWYWMRDCKHRRQEPVLHTADGPYEPPQDDGLVGGSDG